MVSSACVVMALAITTPTYFEICEPCKAQNRGARPRLAPVAQQTILQSASGGTFQYLL